MGDRYELVRNCIYCGEVEEEVYYAPTCGFLTFKCQKCGKENFITEDLKVKKMEDVTYDDVYWAVCNASNMMDEKMIKRYARETFEKMNKDLLKELIEEKLRRVRHGKRTRSHNV